MDIAAYSASILIGVTLGLIGGGGSILTVPVLVYLFKLDSVLSTTYSLFIVGSTSVTGAYSYFKKGLINFKIAVLFGIPSIIAIYFTRNYILLSIPKEIFIIGNTVLTKNIFLMLLFAILMITASYSMIKKEKQKANKTIRNQEIYYLQILLQGIFIGIITGLIGAGSGFLIIPALVNLLKLTMKTAVGTSLVIISINSLMGFTFSLSKNIIDWSFLFSITPCYYYWGTYRKLFFEYNKCKQIKTCLRMVYTFYGVLYNY